MLTDHRRTRQNSSPLSRSFLPFYHPIHLDERLFHIHVLTPAQLFSIIRQTSGKMSDTCIVCLGDLNGGTSHLESPRSSTPSKAESDGGSKSPIGSPIALNSDGTSKPTLKLSRRTTPLELIAHLLPCGHDLHDDCLKPWVERANSCPICRRDFHLVELSEIVGGKSSLLLLRTKNNLVNDYCFRSRRIFIPGRSSKTSR